MPAGRLGIAFDSAQSAWHLTWQPKASKLKIVPAVRIEADVKDDSGDLDITNPYQPRRRPYRAGGSLHNLAINRDIRKKERAVWRAEVRLLAVIDHAYRITG